MDGLVNPQNVRLYTGVLNNIFIAILSYFVNRKGSAARAPFLGYRVQKLSDCQMALSAREPGDAEQAAAEEQKARRFGNADYIVGTS